MILLFLSLLTFCLGNELATVTYAAVTTGNNEIRALAATYDSTENALSVGGFKADLQINNGSATAHVDAGGFKFVGGVQGLKELIVGFSALSATASVNWSEQAGKVIFSIDAAWAEIVFGLSWIFLYKERNSQKGFQYSLGDNVWNCLDNGGSDCIIQGSIIDIQKDLTFSLTNVVTQNCLAVIPNSASVYNPNCTIWTISSTGSYLGTPVITFSLMIASQKVLLNPTVNGHEIGPDYGKVDITINYPYFLKYGILSGEIRKIGNVGLSGYAAGKAGSAVKQGTFDGKSAYVWAAANTDKAAVLAWDGDAVLSTTGAADKKSDVYVAGLSGSSISSYTCDNSTNCDLISQIVINLMWKPAVAWVTAFGWTPEIFVLSWDGLGPDSVYYDPVTGMTSTANIQYSSSGILAPPVLLCFLWILVHFFYHK